ncbi:MAG TPA: hypothetical protein VN421_05035 [Pseudoflavonifractor sp.]|nr:hypothetical protein [Pseudoflavonifractor sp.]
MERRNGGGTVEQHFSLGQRGGALLVRDEGPRAVFEAELPDDGRGLYKAYVCGKGGSTLLGTLTPERGRLRLRRTIPIGELERRGCWPVTGAEGRLEFFFSRDGQRSACAPGWSREENPARLMGERLLARSAGELRGALLRREEGGFSLAAPMEKGGAFPMTPLFCFASLETLCERTYAVFHFNGSGYPVLWNKEDTAGNTEGANQ